MPIRPGLRSSVIVCACLASAATLAACKRSDPPSNPLKTQQDAMARAKDVGTTMQKGVDAEGKKADDEGR